MVSGVILRPATGRSSGRVGHWSFPSDSSGFDRSIRQAHRKLLVDSVSLRAIPLRSPTRAASRRGAAMSDASTNNSVNSTDSAVAPKLPDGATLPFPPTPSASVAGRTLQESTYSPRVTPPRLHEDSPNIVIVLIDDAGPGLPTTFGGEGGTATMDRICAEGGSYT